MARILVIDDENNIRLMVRLTLQAAGHEVETASDGPEGLALFGDGRNWDAVVLDQRMPGMEGLEVLRAMKALAPEVHVVMITAFGTIDLAAQAMKAGATNFLRKPFTTDMLRGAVQSALENLPSAPLDAPDEKVASPLGSTSINGFRIFPESGDTNAHAFPKGSAHDGDDGISHTFSVRDSSDVSHRCEVYLPRYLIELVKAHVDRETIPDGDRFWAWLCEEALANYLWQQAEPPTEQRLCVDELTASLRRWIDAVLT